MIDRFGLLPPQVSNLVELSRLRLRAEDLGIRGIEVGGSGGTIEFKDTTRVNPMSLVKLVQSDPQAYKLAGATRFKFVCELPELKDRQQFIDNLLDNFHSDIAEPAA